LDDDLSTSVLIPAFRPTFLGQAIASVLAQGEEDFELIVSDDSGGDEVRRVVERFRDPRIRYVVTTGRTGALENMRGLWRLAQHDLVKYLFDDDLLMPHALGDLVDVVRARPEVSFVFGFRHVVDERGRVLRSSKPFSAERMELSWEAIANNVVGSVKNPIGEFSNILINRACGITEADFLAYEGLNMHVVTDVGFFLNASRRGPVVGLGQILGAFRKHPNQNSEPAFNPWFAVGICEWELFIRGEYSAGALTRQNALAAISKLETAYVNWARTLPEIAVLAPGLAQLRERVEAGETAVLDPAFRQSWKELESTVGARAAARRAAQSRPASAG
jgi:hypothetical protein